MATPNSVQNRSLQPDDDKVSNGFPRKNDRSLPKTARGWRRIVRNFTPSWFSVNMGTGVVSILLHNLPYNGAWLYWISVVFFALNVLLFVVFLFISIIRYTLYPRIWTAMVRHPTQSLFLGTFPMGFATIVNMVVFVCVPAWGEPFVKLAWVLWWIDVILAVAVCFYLPFVMYVRLRSRLRSDKLTTKVDALIGTRSMYFHKTDLASMTAVCLLPIVAPIVAAASGGVVAQVLPNTQHALITLIVSYVLWGIGVPLAMAVLVIYFQRLAVHKLPPREVIVSVFLPVGPLGQGGFAMQLGSVAMRIFPKTDSLNAQMTQSGNVLYVIGWLMALVMWGFGLVWLFFALASITRHRFPFNMGWWGFTFPLGVFATSTVLLGHEIPSAFFRILGMLFSIVVVLLWIVVAAGTLQRAWTGEIFVATCLSDVEHKESQAARLFKEPSP